jgi:sterol desaturase/sphingolipid hydroxylase (fatty acid hydroxylase superfamily)
MSEFLLQNEPRVRLAVFLVVLVVMAVWELVSPRRRQEIPRLIRWSNNFALVVIDSVVVRIAFPLVAVGLAVFVQHQGWGLFNYVLLPVFFKIILSLIIFDLVIYVQHVVFHAVPFLWRLHRVHHSDLEFDVTTALRFHPLEIILSMGLKLLLVLGVGPPAFAVLVFEVVLNATAMFNHSNVKIPLGFERILRLFVVTPDMHRVHHSIIPTETNSNFGFNLPWWDWLLGTYRDQPTHGHEGMAIGVAQFRNRREQWLDKLLLQPLRYTEKPIDNEQLD